MKEVGSSRKEAIANGYPRYVSKKTCKHCGTNIKYTGKASCVFCLDNRRNTQEYKTKRSWYDMIRRCYNEDSDMYYQYGGRGVQVCDRWLDPENGCENFIEDMGIAPVGHTIDRIDADGHYEPSNCRWATTIEQARNTTTTQLSLDDALGLISEYRNCTKHGEKAEIARKYGVSQALASYTANRSVVYSEYFDDA